MLSVIIVVDRVVLIFTFWLRVALYLLFVVLGAGWVVLVVGIWTGVAGILVVLLVLRLA